MVDFANDVCRTDVRDSRAQCARARRDRPVRFIELDQGRYSKRRAADAPRMVPPHHRQSSSMQEMAKRVRVPAPTLPSPYSSTNALRSAHLFRQDGSFPGSLPKFRTLAVARDPRKKWKPFCTCGSELASFGLTECRAACSTELLKTAFVTVLKRCYD